MLPGVGLQEMLLIAIVAITVVGPKDLPLLLRKFGRWVAKMRAMANDFQSSFEDLARQAELDELRQEMQALRRDTARDLDTLKHAAHIDDPFIEPFATASAGAAAANDANGVSDEPELPLEPDAETQPERQLDLLAPIEEPAPAPTLIPSPVASEAGTR